MDSTGARSAEAKPWVGEEAVCNDFDVAHRNTRVTRQKGMNDHSNGARCASFEFLFLFSIHSPPNTYIVTNHIRPLPGASLQYLMHSKTNTGLTESNRVLEMSLFYSCWAHSKYWRVCEMQLWQRRGRWLRLKKKT